MTPTGEPPRIVVPDEACRRASELLARHGVGDDAALVGMAPGAAYGRREAVAAGAVRAAGAAAARAARGRVGAGRRRGRTGRPAIEIAPGPHVVDLIGQTDLPVLAGVMARSRAFVSNDSGAMHLAAAVGLPVTAIFGATDERATAPLRPGVRVGAALMRYSPATCGAGRACCASARSTIAA